MRLPPTRSRRCRSTRRGALLRRQEHEDRATHWRGRPVLRQHPARRAARPLDLLWRRVEERHPAAVRLREPVREPRLEGSAAALSCRVEAIHEGGDHWIVVGVRGRLPAARGRRGPARLPQRPLRRAGHRAPEYVAACLAGGRTQAGSAPRLATLRYGWLTCTCMNAPFAATLTTRMSVPVPGRGTLDHPKWPMAGLGGTQ